MATLPTCTWCSGPTRRPDGVFLSLLADGRLFCAGCGLYTLSCECVERPKAPTTSQAGPGIAYAQKETERLAIDPWLARRIEAGWHPRAVAAAGGISLRTAYRWKAALVEVRDVEVAGYVAAFAVRRDAVPVRLEAWRRA